MADQQFSQEQLNALVAKLNSADLTAEDRSLLHAIFRAAAGSGEVQGFDVFNMMVDKVLPLLNQPPTTPTPPPTESASLKFTKTQVQY